MQRLAVHRPRHTKRQHNGSEPTDWLCPHARTRMRQRGISAQAIELAQAYGEPIHQNGATVFFLGRRHLPLETRSSDAHALAGTVVVTRHGQVLTTFRCARVPRRLRRR